MGKFLTGVLEKTETGDAYGATRWLALRHGTGRVLRVFDFASMTATLPLGRSYEAVVSPVLLTSSRASYCAEMNTSSKVSVWMAKIISVPWDPASSVFSRVNPEIYERKWVLGETPVGSMIFRISEILEIGRLELMADIIPGHYLEWDEDGRLDLFAVC